MNKIYYNDLMSFTKKVLKKSGLNNQSINAVSIGLCEASLRGVDSHGIKLLSHYVNSAINGRKNINPKMKLTKKFPALGVLDADSAFGHAAGFKAIDVGMKIAKKYGIGAIVVNNSSHCGSMASMALRAARNGYIAFAFTHADALMLTFAGKVPYFGTNPICFAAPRFKKEPYCLDMATTSISWNKLLNYRNNAKTLPINLAADKQGRATQNASIANSLLPSGGYKGFGLASMVEILCGVYSGMKFGKDIPSMYVHPISKKRKLGQFYIVMRTDGFLDSKSFIKRMEKMYKDIYNLEPYNKTKKIMLPNDIEIKTSNERLKLGIPIENNVLKSLNVLSDQMKRPLKMMVNINVN